MGRPTVPTRSRSTRSFTSSATWSASSPRLGPSGPSSSATTGARRSPGTPPVPAGPFSAASRASAFRSVRGEPAARPTSCRRRTIRSSTSSISRRRARPKRSSSATPRRPPAPALFGLGRRAATAGQCPRRPGARNGAANRRLPHPDDRSRAAAAWLTEADIDFYAGEFARTGFRGGLNWYRNIDRNWELMAPFAGLRVTVPALYVAGDRDLVVAVSRHGASSSPV